MTFTSKTLDHNKIKLTVELSKEDLTRHLMGAESSLGQNLEIKGFRKGKAPRDVLRKHVGEEKILETALQSAVQHSLAQAISEQNLDVIEAADLKIQENSPEKLLYTVTLQLFPEAKLPKLTSVQVTRRPVTVEPKEIDETVESIKASRAALSDSTQPAVMGDRVEVDFEVLENGALIEGGLSKNHPLIIGGKNFIPGFEEQLVGMNKGDKKEFSLTAPKDFANKTIAGRNLEFKVTMLDIKKVTLPELTDEFAKTLGKFNNIDQLLLNLKDGIMEEKKEKERQRVRLEIMDKIAAGSECHVPPKMVEDQLDTMIRNFDQDLHGHDMELSMYLAKLGKTEEDLRKEWRSQAERQVKLAIIVRAIARQQDITVSPEESDEALEAVMQSTLAQKADPASLNTEQIRQNIESRIINDKVFEYLEKTCIV